MSDLTRERQTVLIDASTLARWIGTPVGMLRVEHELVHAVISSNRGQPVFYDPRTHRYADFVPAGGRRSLIGMRGLTLGASTTRHRQGLAGGALYPRAIPCRTSRTPPASCEIPLVAAAFEGLRQAILAIKPHKLPIRDAYGRLVDVIPLTRRWVTPSPFRRDTLFVPASDWTSKDLSALKRQKE